MHHMLRTGAAALIFAAAIAGAHAQQTPPQNGETPAATEEKANEAARERIEQMPDQSGAGIGEARGGEGSPRPDQAIGPPNAGPVPLRGDGLDLPGATPQTAPAKYSQENAERADYSIMGYPVQLSDEQRRAIRDAVGSRSATASSLGTTIHAEAGVFLPPNVEAEELPGSINQQIPGVRGLKYVRTSDKILLVAPSNGIVRGVIEE